MPDWLWIQNVVFPIIGFGIAAGVLYGIYRTINRHLERRHERTLAEGGGGPAREQLERLERRLEALEDTGFRMQELEERLDFAERMLTQQRERDRLAPGREGRG